MPARRVNVKFTDPPADPPAPAAAAAVRPRLGDRVFYRLSGPDADQINQRRAHWRESPPAVWGYQAHVGNPAVPGHVYPATVVRVFDDCVNLQVFLDGCDTLWVTSADPRRIGTGE